jgi:hypothetical protein
MRNSTIEKSNDMGLNRCQFNASAVGHESFENFPFLSEVTKKEFNFTVKTFDIIAS